MHTRKEVLPLVVSDWQIGSSRHMGEVDSGLEYFENKCTVKYALLGFIAFLPV